MTKLIAIAALAALCFLNCSAPLPPDYQLTDTRILAMRSDPTSLVPDGNVTLDALVYVPPGVAQPSYSWAWCPRLGTAADDYACALDATTLQTALDPTGSLGITINYSLGTTSSVSFAYPVSVTALQALCAPTPGGASSGGSTGSSSASGSSSSSSGGSSGGSTGGTTTTLPCNSTGLPISIVLTLTVGSDQIRAYRALDLLFAADTSGDTNPTISDFSLTASGATSPATSVTAATSYALLSNLPTDDSTSSSGPVQSDGSTPTLLGGLSLNWYVSAGTLTSSTTTLAPAIAPDTRNWTTFESNSWVTPKVTTASSAAIIVVVRDTHNGVGWLTQSVDLLGGR